MIKSAEIQFQLLFIYSVAKALGNLITFDHISKPKHDSPFPNLHHLTLSPRIKRATRNLKLEIIHMSAPVLSSKPKLNYWQIWNMSLGFFGIQFGFALQNGNASRILGTFGAEVEHLSLFWLAAPLTGMIIQPIIGHYSDHTWTRLGRRRPYFLSGAILASIALMFMPNANVLVNILPPLYVGAGILMIMDASFNVAMEPFRALVADLLPSDQRTLGFSIQTFLIGMGAVIGSWLPYIFAEFFDVSKTAAPGEVPLSVTFSFYTGAIIFLVA